MMFQLCPICPVREWSNEILHLSLAQIIYFFSIYIFGGKKALKVSLSLSLSLSRVHERRHSLTRNTKHRFSFIQSAFNFFSKFNPDFRDYSNAFVRRFPATYSIHSRPMTSSNVFNILYTNDVTIPLQKASLGK